MLLSIALILMVGMALGALCNRCELSAALAACRIMIGGDIASMWGSVSMQEAGMELPREM